MYPVPPSLSLSPPSLSLRNDVLYAHNDKMMKCLVSMESALNGSWDLTEGLLQSMRETLSFMTNETTSAANWLVSLARVI